MRSWSSSQCCGRWCCCRRCCDPVVSGRADSIGDFNYRLDVLGRTNGTSTSRTRAPRGATREPPMPGPRPHRAGAARVGRAAFGAPAPRRDAGCSPVGHGHADPGRGDARRRSRGRCRSSSTSRLVAFLGLWAWARSVAGRAQREGALHAGAARARARVAPRRVVVASRAWIARAEIAARRRSRPRDVRREAPRPRDHDRRVAPGDPSVRGVDPRDASRRVRRGGDARARSA